MTVIRNNIIPFKGFAAINICGLLFVRTEAKVDSELLNHERIHTAQMKELGYVGFYLIYLIEWIAGLCKGMSSNEAYHAISFEREAYGHEGDLSYLYHRQPWAQWK